MKLTLRIVIENTWAGLLSLESQKLKGKLPWRLSKIIRTLRKEITEFNEYRDECVKKHTAGETVDKAAVKRDIDAALDEMVDLEVEIDQAMIDEQTIEWTAAEITAVEVLLGK